LGRIFLGEIFWDAQTFLSRRPFHNPPSCFGSFTLLKQPTLSSKTPGAIPAAAEDAPNNANEGSIVASGQQASRDEDAGPLASGEHGRVPEASPRKLYDRSFLFVFASQTSFVIANSLMAHYSRWIEYLGGDLSQIGWIMGAGALAGLVLRPWLAQLINRLGAKQTWLIGYAIFSLASLANCLLFDLSPAIYLIRAANVFGAAVVFASSLTYISQIAPEHRRTEAIGMLGIGGFFGMMIGPYLGDAFQFADARNRAQFLNIFVVAAVANLVPALFLLLVRSPDHHREIQSFHPREFLRTIRMYWPGAILLVDLAFGACMTVPFVFVANYIDQVPLRIEGMSELGYFFFSYCLAGISLRLLLRRLPERIGAERVLSIGMLFMTVGLFSFGLVSAEHPLRLALPALLCGVGHGLIFHTMTSLTIQPFPPALRGTGSALALMMLDAGTFLGAPILGLIGEYFGYSGLFFSLGLFCLFSLLIYLRKVTPTLNR
jgi:MFS family permease